MNKHIQTIRETLSWLDTDEKTSTEQRHERIKNAMHALDQIENKLRGKRGKIKPLGVIGGPTRKLYLQ